MTPFQNIKPTTAFLNHPGLTGAGGAVLGYAAASGNPWALLGCIGSIAAWLQARRMTKARDAARQAAIDAATACGDPNDPTCRAEAIEAAKAAGLSALGSKSVRIPLWATFVLGAVATFIIVSLAMPS